MKKYFFLSILCGLLATQARAQLKSQDAFVHITPGSTVIALNSVVNTAGSTLTVDGTLNTPGDLSNSSGATLQGDGQYGIGGDWINDATFNAGASTVTFEGVQNSAATSGGDAFFNINLNKTGGNNLVLADALTVTNTLDFQAADNYVVLGDHNLQVVDIVGYDADRHVRTNGTGFLVRTVGGSAVFFPIGNTAYNPATLNNAGTPDLYFLRVADAVLSGGQTGSPLTADAVSRGWFVEEGTPGGSDLSMTLLWNGNEEQATFNRTMAYVSHFLAGSWDMQPTAVAAGSDPYTLSRSGITSLSPFAILDGDFLPLIGISGIILWEQDGVSGVKDATVALSGDDTDSDLTPLDGMYTLTASNGSNFTVTPIKTMNKLNGITSADALAIQQHVTGINPIASPYKQVAADVNKSNSISTFDASVLNQALLGNPAALAQIKTSWRFVPVSYSMTIPPWGFPEKISLTGVAGDVPGQDFWGIKTGDVVDAWANPANFGAGEPLVLRVQDQRLQAGQEISAVFRADQLADLASFQFALYADPMQIRLVSIEPEILGGLPMTADNFGTYNVAEGEIRALWVPENAAPLEEATTLFRLRFETLQSGALLSEVLQLNDAALPGKTYNSQMEESGVALKFIATTATSNPADADGLQLLQNQPNPFTDETTIGFVLPAGAGCDAQLRIFDATGRELWRLDKYYPAGYNAERVRLENVTASGVLWYELTTPYGTLTKRMVRVGE